MSIRSAWAKYWRVPVIAALCAVLTFAASFLVDPTYESSTRLLIRARDTSFLTSTGAALSTVPLVVDSGLSKSLAETYAGVATSRTIAVGVVDRLGLDREPDRSGPLAAVSDGVNWVLRCTRAFLTSGFCADPDRREVAITTVQGDINAQQLGATAGEASGQPSSYILQIGATGTTPELAGAIANSVADELIATSDERFRADVDTYIQSLQRQIDAANADVTARSDAVTEFKNANGISSADDQLVLAATAYQGLQTDLVKAKADLADRQAQLTSIEASLANTSQTQSGSQSVQGDSRADVQIEQANPVYSDLQIRRAAAQADIAGLQARIDELQAQVDAGSPVQMNAAQAQLAQLTQSLTLAQKNQTDLTTAMQQANATAQTDSPELTRIDEAPTPIYPIAPKRYLYLLLGLLLGGLAGLGLTWLAGRRTDPVPMAPAAQTGDAAGEPTADPADEGIGLFDPDGDGQADGRPSVPVWPDDEPAPLPVPASRGASNGAATFGHNGAVPGLPDLRGPGAGGSGAGDTTAS